MKPTIWGETKCNLKSIIVLKRDTPVSPDKLQKKIKLGWLITVFLVCKLAQNTATAPV